MAQVAGHLSEEQRKFVDENPFVGVVTTIRPDGSPHSTVVWADVELDGTPSFNTARGRSKPSYLEENPHVALLVLDPQDAYKWVSISGRAELTEEDADAQIDKLAKKYLGKDRYPFRKEGEVRVKVLIHPERIDSTGFES